MAIFETTDVAGYWGATRSVRGLAVAIRDHCARVGSVGPDAIEQAIIAELDLADVPTDYAICVQACIQKSSLTEPT